MAVKHTAQRGLFPPVIPILVTLIIFMPVLCCAIEVNCAKPDQISLLEALTPVFNMSAIRPVLHPNTYTNVSMFFTLYGILGVDEKSQLLVTYIWLSYWWINEFISWDEVQCGTSRISLPKEKFWLPDIVINEFMEENKAPSVPYTYLYNNGKVISTMPVKVVSSCNLDIYTFPFDIQNCTLTFNSYIYYAIEIKILLGRSTEMITNVSKNVMTTMGEWELIDITAKKLETDDERGLYTDKLAFYIRVKRRSTMYVVNLLIPSCFLITVDLFSFLLPPQSVDRSSFKMTLILGYTVFLLLMNDLLPVTGNTIPLINVFFSLCLALMVASLLETILITNLLCCSANFSPVPRWIQFLVLKFMGFLVCMPRKTKKPKESESKTGTVEAKNNTDERSPESRELAEEDKALQELRNLSQVLHSIRSEVEEHQKGNQSSDEWIQCCPMKVKSSKLLVLLISLLMHGPCNSAILNCSQPDQISLLRSLQPVFDLSPIRPVANLSTPTVVRIYFTLFGILGVDEKAQVLTTFIWQVLEWRNEFSMWDSEACGSEWIAVPRTLLWVPDIVINEFMEKNSAPAVPYTYLYYEGLVFDEQPVRVVSSCSLDIYLFPFDTQNCTFSFNPYLHGSPDIQLELAASPEEILERSKAVMSTMGEWSLVAITGKKSTIPATFLPNYDEICFFISVRRHATMYVVNLLIPSCFLITVDLFSFVLPPQNIDRSLFKMTLVLGYTVFLLSTNDMLPITGNTIPLINVFLSLCLALMVASLVETIFVTNLLQGSAHYNSPPRWIQLVFLHILGRLVLLPPKSKQPEDVVIQNLNAQELEEQAFTMKGSKTSEQKKPLSEDKTLQVLKDLSTDLQVIHLQVVKQLKGGPGTEEWIQIGFIIDRLLFILYILFISVSFITIIIIWMKSYNTP